MPIGSCRRGIASLVGVSQVTLFCSGLCRTIRVNSNFIENLWRYSQVKVHHWYQGHRRANLPLVTPTPVHCALVPALAFLFIPVLDCPDAGQSGILAFEKEIHKPYMSTLQAKDWNTPCIFTLLMVKGRTPCMSMARPLGS